MYLYIGNIGCTTVVTFTHTSERILKSLDGATERLCSKGFLNDSITDYKLNLLITSMP